MVYLNRIYTRTGDEGTTALWDGTRVPKTHPRIVAYGTVDELNCVLGVAVASNIPESVADQIRHIQHDLFDVGADLCVPQSVEPTDGGPLLRVVPEQVATLETWIDAATERLEPLTSFILPGGTPGAAHLHHARTVCRRAEIAVLALAESETINPQAAVYLNRLSDLLFVLARLCNDNGRADVLWKPGKNRS